MNNLIRTGIIIAMVSIAGTAGTAGLAHHTAASNAGSVPHISALADGPTQDATNDGFGWG